MWPFSSFSSLARFCTLSLTLLCLSLAPSVGPSRVNAAISGVVAGATQQIPDPIPPCTLSGFSIDSTLNQTILSGQTVRWHRVERRRDQPRVGYAVTTNSVSNEMHLVSYDARNMSINRDVVIQAAGGADYGTTSVVGEVVGGQLYLILRVNFGRLGCNPVPANQCVSLSKYDSLGNKLGETVVGSIPMQVVDDARTNGASTLLVSYGDGVDRKLMSFSIPGGSLISVSGSVMSPGTLGQFALNGDAGAQYIAYSNSARTVKRIALDSVTVTATGNFTYTFSNTTGSPVVVPGLALIGESISFGGINADENYMSLTGLANIGNTFPWNAADGSAAPRSTFYDGVNGQLYSWRDSTGRIARLAPLGGVVLERFDCGIPCVASSLPTTDFVEPNGRLYIATGSALQLTITRIKVCATGGPPA